MRVYPLKSRIVQERDDLFVLLKQALEPFGGMPREGVLAVTSKVVSLCEGRLVPKHSVENKFALVRQEADAFLPEGSNPWNVHLTIKNHALIASAGIDESNTGSDAYILYPEDVQKSARDIWHYTRQEYAIDFMGVIIVDSHVTPLRGGVTGIGLAWCGFEPLYNYVGLPDLFGRPLQVTRVNMLDALAGTAVFVMGEGDERTPFAILEDIPKIAFVPRPPTREEEMSIFIDAQNDIYASLLSKGEWTWNER